jgi:outer membrane protein TolC
MSTPHEPRETFVGELEGLLRGELQRRRLAASAPGWLPRSRAGLAMAAAALVVCSMAIGGGVVAAAYEAQRSEQRDMLVATLEQRAALAKRRLDLAHAQLREVQARIAVGLEHPPAAGEARLKVTEAEAEVRIVELDLAEVRATGREPLKTVSAPLVSGRDLVSDRWRVEATVPAAALEIARQHADATKVRYDVGLANSVDVETAGARQFELEAVVQLAQRKIAIRQSFLGGALTAAVADLRMIEAETEQRRASLLGRIEFSRRHLQDIKVRVEIGTAAALEVAEAEVRLQELQLALTKADYDLALIRQQLGK